jgi:uncharacterized membrane protein YccC
VALHLIRLPLGRAREEADFVLRRLPQELRAAPVEVEPMLWMAEPSRLRQICDGAVQAQIALPVGTPSLRLLADHTAEALAGMSKALNGVALLLDDPTRPFGGRPGVRLNVPDWLPALVNSGRAFVTIGVVAFFWVVTAWPGGAGAMTFAAIGVILFAPRADQAYATTMSFMVGTALTASLAAIIEFAVLPGMVSFVGFSLAIGLVLVPAGALMAQPWQVAMFTAITANFTPLLAPANPMSYDTQQFYNSALAIVAGVCAGAISFRLLPPLSSAFRTRRLLTLTLRDLRRLATSPIIRAPDDWQARVFSRLFVLPDAAEPLQRSQLVAALSVGNEIIQLRRIAHHLNLGSYLDPALRALAQGNSAAATDCLAQLDHTITVIPEAKTGAPLVLRARGSILAISESLHRHAAYFDAGARG